MLRTTGLCVLASLSLLALPAVGQDDGGNVAEIHCLDVQLGAEAKFEDAWKKHIDWHREQGDTWTWNAWNIMTGPNSGSYCAGTFGHKWEDFDNPAVSREADEADVQATFWPFVKDHRMTFSANLPKVSRPADDPASMSSVIFFNVRFGMDDEFNYLIGEFHKAIEKTETPWRYRWFRQVSGGEGGTYVLVLPRANFASFNPSGKPFPEMLEEAYGREAADTLLASWRKVVKGTRNVLTKARPDLSYIPKP